MASSDAAERALAIQLRHAREHALLGNLPRALELYEAVLDTLRGPAFVSTVWQAVREDAASEARVAQELQRELATFASPPAEAAEPPSLPPAQPVAQPRAARSASPLTAAPSARRLSSGSAAAVPARKPALPPVFGTRPSSAGGRKPSTAATGSAGVASASAKPRPKFSDTVSPADTQLAASIETDMLLAVPETRFDDIAGLDAAKGLLQETLILPLLMPEFFTGVRRPWRGILLYGPPGTGKTLLAKAVANECGTSFFNVSASTLSSKWRGESERMVRLLFEAARYHAPSVIFMDEIDALTGARGEGEHEASRRVKTELLGQMDGMQTLGSRAAAPPATAAAGAIDGPSATANAAPPRVVVIGASNVPWELDEAFRRRFEKRIYIPLPDARDREHLLGLCMRGLALAPDVDVRTLAARTDGYSGADLANVVRDAAMMPLRKLMALARGGSGGASAVANVGASGGGGIEALRRALASEATRGSLQDCICQSDLSEALSKIAKSVAGANLSKYNAWQEEFGAT